MKLATDIKPRMSGTVTAKVEDTTYEFKGQPLECDVENEQHSAFLLNTGSFFPADSADFERAKMQINPLLTSTNVDEDDDDDADESEMPNGGAPLEALTPAKVSNKAPRKVK